MSVTTIILIVFIAFLAGLEGILDQFQFHSTTSMYINSRIVSGHAKEGIILGGSLQMIALDGQMLELL